jgi:hypothetical protein
MKSDPSLSTIEPLVYNNCTIFLDKIKEINNSISSSESFAIRLTKIDRIYDLIQSFNEECYKDFRRESATPIINIVLSTFQESKILLSGISINKINFLLWRLENDWKYRSLIIQKSPIKKTVGFLLKIWGITSGYGTKLKNLVSTSIIIWLFYTFIITLIDFVLGKTEFCKNPTEIANYLSKTLYTTFSILTGIGNVDTSMYSHWAYYVTLMSETLFSYVLFASIISLISTSIFFNK